ncbi:uncharacterized protein L969DRAFT_48794 [Mixia osmundae IAM 14324]|uniref:USP domain-containing protein n=1 Tax=Mixia osmundae (strain CBS 9802 / IAM 14324 / JCM 22182 / KY 12970) TaxID=764103 RepID=G7EA86_MIXOS|nr:uncharacterized protein L969DRAFT_48794 [Mixia osmundae IAM 14324]KEI39438.1 hypothetical protein L969DRAFT_48794 [Mixia osmundae IAM 14324]GAA99746.1 hypothetical protein E5Q_06449 [Mixia osmundae IAM 14324]
MGVLGTRKVPPFLPPDKASETTETLLSSRPISPPSASPSSRRRSLDVTSGLSPPSSSSHLPRRHSRSSGHTTSHHSSSSGTQHRSTSNAVRKSGSPERSHAAVLPVPSLADKPKQRGSSGSSGTGTSASAIASPSATGVRQPGLVNLGNSCFLNCTIQSLSATDPLEQILGHEGLTTLVKAVDLAATSDAVTPEGTVPDRIPGAINSPSLYCLAESETQAQQTLPLTRSLHHLLTQIWSASTASSSSRTKTISPNRLLRELAKKRDEFDGNEQQDAHELLRVLLDTVRMEEADLIKQLRPPPAALKRSRRRRGTVHANAGPPVISSEYVANASGSEADSEASSSDSDSESPSTAAILPPPQALSAYPYYSFIDRLFCGRWASTIVCEVCLHASTIHEDFLDISVPMKTEADARLRRRDRIRQLLGRSANSGSEKDKSPAITYSETEASGGEDTLLSQPDEDARVRRRKSLDPAMLNSKRHTWLKPSSANSASREPSPSRTEHQHHEKHRSRKAAPIPRPTREQSAYVKELLRDLPKTAILPLHGLRIAQPNGPAEVRAASSSNPGIHPGPKLSHIAKEQMHTGLYEALRQFTSVEVLEGDNAFQCRRCWKYLHGQAMTTRVPQTPKAVERYAPQPGMQEAKSGMINVSDSRRSSVASTGLYAPVNESTHSLSDGEVSGAEGDVEDAASAPVSEVSSPSFGPTRMLTKASSSSLTDSDRRALASATAISFAPEKALTTPRPERFVLRRAWKRYLIATLPLVLCLHVKRFRQSGKSSVFGSAFSNLKKVDDMITFPEYLDMSVFMFPKQTVSDDKQIYRLYAVIEHIGTLGGGHYVAHVCRADGEKRRWFHCSDEDVRPTDISKLNAHDHFGSGHCQSLASGPQVHQRQLLAKSRSCIWMHQDMTCESHALLSATLTVNRISREEPSCQPSDRRARTSLLPVIRSARSEISSSRLLRRLALCAASLTHGAMSLITTYSPSSIAFTPSASNICDYIFSSPFTSAPVSSQHVAMKDAISGEALTRGELRRRAQVFAFNLAQSVDATRGEEILVLVHSPNSSEYAIVQLACWSLGFTLTAAPAQSTVLELAEMLHRCTPTIIFSTESQLVQDAVDIWRFKHRKHLPSQQIRLQGLYVAGMPTALGVKSWDSLHDPPQGGYKAPARKAYGPACILWSSGTSGRSKQIVHTHQSIIAAIKASCQRASRSPNQSWLALAPFSHAFGMVSCELVALTLGITLVLPGPFAPQQLLDVIRSHRIKTLHVAPVIVAMLANSSWIKPSDLAYTKRICSGGAPLSAHLARKMWDKYRIIVDLDYGSSETLPVAGNVSSRWSEAEASLGSVGKPVPDCEVIIDDDEMTGQGEILVKSLSVMNGYRGTDTVEPFTHDGYFRTGDLGRFDEHGNLYIISRLKDMIKVRSFQVSPTELEEIAMSVQGVAEVAVAGIWVDSLSTQLPRAFIVPAESVSIEEHRSLALAVIQTLGTRVARYKQLDAGVVLCDALPRNHNGKIMKQDLARHFASNEVITTPEQANRLLRQGAKL